MFLPEKAIIEFILLNVTRILEKFPNHRARIAFFSNVTKSFGLP
ncbi:MAG: hypothetical protein WB014_11015 [Methanosarcina sp.]